MLELREYQDRGLRALAEYLRLSSQHGAKAAFVLATERPYRTAPQLEGIPYVCLRVPTGGGKTLMACHAIGIVTKNYLETDRVLCLWLVPSNAIRDQTLSALRNRLHPYRQAIDATFGGDVRVMDLTEALYVTRGDLEGSCSVLVTTLQSLRVEDTEGRKVYESAGALQHHFDGLSPSTQAMLEQEGNGRLVYSLANVLRMHRPVVVMDEAHNARTTLSFDTLARLDPSSIIEFTATPETRHEPQRGLFASNILHQTSALELKEAEMVKLPVKLRTRTDWREVVADALQNQRYLEQLAEEELAETGEYIRPIVLFQAQSVTGDDVTVDVLKTALQADFRVPAKHIAVATGSTRGIEGIDLFCPTCPIRFILTVRALVEGWDCSFAYTLCSVSGISTPRAVEQVLGRILRLPKAKRKRRDALNCAYAFACSENFITTAQSLRDALVEGAGFQRIEADELVAPAEIQGGLFGEAAVLPARVVLSLMTPPDLSGLSPGLRSRVQFDESSGSFTLGEEIREEEEIQALRGCLTSEHDRRLLTRALLPRTSRVAIEGEQSTLRVPLLARRVAGQLEILDESSFLDSPWSLAGSDPRLSEADFPNVFDAGGAGEIDVTSAGRLAVTNLVMGAHEQISLLDAESGWTVAGLANWLDRQIAHPDISQSETSLFIHRMLTSLLESRGLGLEHLARHKYRLARAIEAKIDVLRRAHHAQAYQAVLFGSASDSIEVSPELCLTYDESHYAPSWYYEGGYQFQKHLFPVIGELKPEGEEFECAVHLDRMPDVKAWVRNLERRPETSFWLQTPTDRFYPDFVILLKDGRVAVVEYKGAHLWSNDDSREKRAIGELWADKSGEACLFVMPKGPDWKGITEALGRV